MPSIRTSLTSICERRGRRPYTAQAQKDQGGGANFGCLGRAGIADPLPATALTLPGASFSRSHAHATSPERGDQIKTELIRLWMEPRIHLTTGRIVAFAATDRF
jgi:hypothetical protein